MQLFSIRFFREATMTVRLLPPHARRVLRKGQLAYFVLVDDAGTGRYAAPSGNVPTVLQFHEGALSIGPFIIRKPRLRDDSVSWTQRSNFGYTTGHLYFGRSASELHGWIAIGDSEQDAVIYDIIATSLPLGQYETRFESTGEADAVLSIGAFSDHGYNPEIVARLGDRTAPGYVGASLDKKGRPHLALELPSQEGETAFAEIAFNVGLEGDITFEGTVKRYSANATRITQRWTGSRLPEISHPEIQVTLEYVDATLSDPAAALAENEEISAEQRELSALASLVPSDEEVGKKLPEMMLENMKWAMSRDSDTNEITSRRIWLTTYYGETAPAIADKERQDIIALEEGWYRSTMATALVANAISRQSFDSSLVPRPISADQKGIITEYVSKCLPAEKEFRSQQDRMWQFAALGARSGLKPYVEADKKIMASQANQPDAFHKTWAGRLLDFYTEQSRIERLITNVMNSSTVPQTDASSPEDKDKGTSLEEATRQLEGYRQDLLDEQARENPDPRLIRMLTSLVKSSEDLVASVLLNEQNAERQAQERQQAALFNMRNVCSLLKILDPTEQTTKVYMTTVFGQLTASVISKTPVGTILKHQELMVSNITSIFNDIADGSKTVFGADGRLVQDALIEEMANLRHEHGETTQSIARKMTYALTISGGKTFQECSGNWAKTFHEANPKLAKASGVLSRVFLTVAFAFVMAHFLNNLDSVPQAEDSTEDKVRFWGTFSLLSVETLRCLVPALKSLLSDIGSAAANVASAAGKVLPMPAWLVKTGEFFKSLPSVIGKVIKYIATGVIRGAVRLADFASGLTFVRSIRYLCNLIARGIGIATEGVKIIASGVANKLSAWTNGIMTWLRNNETLQSVFRFIDRWAARAFTVVVSIAFVVLDTLDLINVWKSDKSMEEKVLASVQYGVSVISAAAMMVGMAIGSTAWTGVGLVLGLVAVGIALLIAKLFPPESSLQKTITQVLSGFIDNVAKPKVDDARRMEKLHVDELARNTTLSVAAA